MILFPRSIPPLSYKSQSLRLAPLFQIPSSKSISCKRTLKVEAANRLKTVLDEGQRASMGVWQMIPGSNVSRLMARSGVDWVLVDQEHGNIDGEWEHAVLHWLTSPAYGE